jgi:Putative transposase of IS4/5 family (DUF4096)
MTDTTKPWLVEDGLWALVEPLLPVRSRRARHPRRRALDDRLVLQGILFVLHTGIAWALTEYGCADMLNTIGSFATMKVNGFNENQQAQYAAAWDAAMEERQQLLQAELDRSDPRDAALVAEDNPLSQSVTVTTASNCGDAATTPVSFHNTPLTNLSVAVDSQVDGGTASTINCVDSASSTIASGSSGANGDASASASDLRPGTYTCTVVIDP